MRWEIAACALAIRMLIVVSVFAQDPSTKPDDASRTVPTAQAQGPQRIRVKEAVQKAKLMQMVSPMYPPITDKRVDGTVLLRVIIGKSGAVKSARYVSGPANLMKSAIDAVLQWRYEPTLVKGVAVEVHTTVSVVFPPLVKQEPPAKSNQLNWLNAPAG
jgi:TonB family protein